MCGSVFGHEWRLRLSSQGSQWLPPAPSPSSHPPLLQPGLSWFQPPFPAFRREAPVRLSSRLLGPPAPSTLSLSLFVLLNASPFLTEVVSVSVPAPPILPRAPASWSALGAAMRLTQTPVGRSSSGPPGVGDSRLSFSSKVRFSWFLLGCMLFHGLLDMPALS